MLDAFRKLKESLSKTKENFLGKLSTVVFSRAIDEGLLEEIEEILLQADVGYKATERLLERIREESRKKKLVESDQLISLLRTEIAAILATEHKPSKDGSGIKPVVWLITGVNGVGKTTTIGKLASNMTKEGKTVMIAACDTFRAAAIDQIAIWAERSGVEIVRARENADPAAVAFDAAAAARARGIDVLLVDTAGRLHTKSHLMDELKKIRRVVEKGAPGATVYSKLVVDGNAGQNVIQQVKVFKDAVGCDGLIITKLDGTAKGGVVIAIVEELGVPVDFVGIGEKIDDIQKFNPDEFAEALLTK